MKTTSTAQHTLGPWEVFNSNKENFVITKTNPKTKADCIASLGAENIAIKRAALIAAAPELLAACKNAGNVLAALATGQIKNVKRDSPTLLAIRAAIAKAEGRV